MTLALLAALSLGLLIGVATWPRDSRPLCARIIGQDVTLASAEDSGACPKKSARVHRIELVTGESVVEPRMP